MRELEKLKLKLICLLREETEFYDKASLKETIKTLIECTAYILDNAYIENDEDLEDDDD